MKEYSFKELEPDILLALGKLDKIGLFGKNKNLKLLDGFAYLPIQNSIGGDFNIGARSLPVVIVIDTVGGQVWQFSLKQLLPEKEF